jgi:cytochrome b561
LPGGGPQVGWRGRAIAASHLCLAELGLSVALIGWAGSSAGNYGQEPFGIISVPNLIPKMSAKEAVWLYALHKAMIPYFLALAGLHLAGVLFHLVILRDGTLKAMWFGWR